MRAVGWICIGLALLIAAGSFGYISWEKTQLEKIMREYELIPHVDRYQIAARRYISLEYRPWLIAAGALAAFGILLLALRPPREKD